MKILTKKLLSMVLEEIQVEKIQILIVNDSEEARNQLRNILEEEQEFRIVGEAETGKRPRTKQGGCCLILF